MTLQGGARTSVADDRYDRLVWVLIAAGIALRLWHFAGDTALWLDEVALATNIVERDFAGLLQPLRYGQIAPDGFLLAERAMWNLFRSEWSLRIIPLIASIGSLFLMRALARRALTGVGVALAVGLMAVAVPHILFAVQVKGYASGVFLALMLQLLAARFTDPHGTEVTRAGAALTGLAGALAVFFASRAVFVEAGAVAGMGLLMVQGRVMNQSRAIKFVVAPWLASVAVATYVARHRMSPSTTSFMYEFWHGSFAPFPPSSLSDLGWPLRAIRLMFGVPWGMQYRLATVFLVLSLIGFVALWRTRRELAPILVGPLLVTLGAAVLQLYPFEGRLVLFLTPAMFVAVAAGTTTIAEWAEARWRHAGALVFLLVALPPAERIIRTPPVYRVQRTRTVLRWIRDHRRPGDLIYVWYRAVPNVAWYGRAFGVAGNDVIAGSCINGGLRRILTETNALRGKPRVWFILTGGSSPDERKLTEYTDAIAIRRAELQTETEYGYYPIEARLYDFSDPTRLARARAATFPIDVRAPTKAQIMSCTQGPLSLHNPA